MGDSGGLVVREIQWGTLGAWLSGRDDVRSVEGNLAHSDLGYHWSQVFEGEKNIWSLGYRNQEELLRGSKAICQPSSQWHMKEGARLYASHPASST